MTQKPLIADQYSENIRNEITSEFRSQGPEFGIKYTKPFGRFDASLGFGMTKTEEWAQKAVNGINSTFGSEGLIESKPYVLPTDVSEKKMFDDNILSAELGFSPIKGLKVSLKDDYNLRDKRNEISAKIGFQFGGNKKRK
jgi:hypothetical protein